MKAVVCFIALFAIAVLARPALDRDIISQVNAGNHGWVAGHNSRFDGLDWEDAKRLCGTVLQSPEQYDGLVRQHKVDVNAIPDSFDAAQECT